MRLQKRSVRTAILFVSAAWIGLGAPAAHASFDFSPITAELAPTGGRASTTFSVVNTSDRKSPIQIHIVPREPDPDGKEVYKDGSDSDDRFQVYPSQFILNPKERRSVRVNYVGSANPKSELAFRIIAEELPIDVETNKTYKKPVGVVLVANKYIGSIYVTPVGTQPKITVKAAPAKEETKEDAKEKKLVFEVENMGTAHYVMRKFKLTLTDANKNARVEVPSDDLRKHFNQNVLAGRTRRFTLPWPKALPVGAVKVDLETLPD